MRYLNVYGWVEKCSIYIQIKSAFIILVDLHTNYLTILFEVLSVKKTELDFNLNTTHD